MSKLQYLYTCHEVALDNNDEYVKDYDTNLPHHDLIAKEMCKSFNDMHMEQFFDGILKDNIESCVMTFRKENNQSTAVVTITGKPGFRFSTNRREEVWDQLDGQFSDGWGEGFFGYVNIMQDDAGNKFIVE